MNTATSTKSKIELGKSYTLRNGLKTSPLRAAKNGTNYIYEAEVMEPGYTTPSVLCWTYLGKYLGNDITHNLDIVVP